ncbi:hypothetical protein L6Q79_14920 [bacterium]|nr:hypothetical protein [bacterium]
MFSKTMSLTILLMLLACDNSDVISGYTETDSQGDVISEDEDDWRVTIKGESVISAPEVAAAFPNPTNGPIEFRYKIASSMKVTMYIKSSKRIVRYLMDDQFMSQGFHSIIWDLNKDDGDRISNGLYRCVFKFKHGNTIYTSYGDIKVVD